MPYKDTLTKDLAWYIILYTYYSICDKSITYAGHTLLMITNNYVTSFCIYHTHL